MTIRRLRVLLVVLVIGLLPMAAAPRASAATGDAIRRLDATYTVNKDGSVDVDYLVDYHFGSKDRHGITFSIATGEPHWTDLARSVTYGVGDVVVTDQAGKALPFTSLPNSDDQTERSSLDLRIGDPDRTVDGTEATYRVRWHGTGMLRTTNGLPRLDWTVTSTHMPPVEAYRVAVVTPGPASSPLCEGATTCQAETTPQGVVFHGVGIPADTEFTVRVDMAAGSVVRAEPQTADRRPARPLATASSTTWTVAGDGSMTVVEEYDMISALWDRRVTFRLPVRSADGERQDRLTPVEEVSASWDGSSTPVERVPPRQANSQEDALFSVVVPTGPHQQRLRLSYRVRGVVDTRSGTATVAWPTAEVAADPRARRLMEVRLPGKALYADCAGESLTDPQLLPVGREGLRGSTVRCLSTGQGASSPREVHFDAASVPGSRVLLEASRDHARTVLEHRALAEVSSAVALACALPWLARVRRRRHLRLANTPVGVIDETAEQVVDDNPQVPVRFTPPEATLAEVGSLLGVDPSRLLAAVLARLAAAGAIAVEHPPLAVRKVDLAPAPVDDLEAAVHREADAATHVGATAPSRVAAMARRAQEAMEGARRRLHVPGTLEMSTTRVRVVVAACLLVLLAALVRAGTVWGGVGVLLTCLGLVPLTISALFGLFWPQQGVRTGRATAIHDQLVGFRTYLTTAEADQLRFEEGEDIFGRYLPWAILFNVADRWARVCRAAVDKGLAPDVDTARLSSLSSWSTSDDFTRDLDSACHWTPPSSGGDSSGGSRGGRSWSSGSRSSSGSGSSGGGVSIDSW